MYRFKADVMWRVTDPLVHEFIGMKIVGDTLHGTCWLAGGALRGLVDKDDVLVDVDLFFSNMPRAAEVAVDLERLGFKVIFKCPKGELTTYVSPKPEIDMENAILSDGRQIKVQLVTKMTYATVDDMLGSFDIDACRFAYDGDHVYTDRAAIRSVRRREITLHNVTHPNATFKRILKYRDKGYRVTNEAVDFFTQKVYDMGMNEVTLQKQFYVD